MSARPLVVRILPLLALVLFAAAPAAQASPTPAPALTLTPLTWDTIGLDSNKPETGPATFPVGARVCNTSSKDLTGVQAQLVWDSENPLITLDGPAERAIGDLKAGACADVYVTAAVKQTSEAFGTTRAYRIVVTSKEEATGSTPKGRQLLVEKLVSQNRNHALVITGKGGCPEDQKAPGDDQKGCDPAPSDLTVGQTYVYKLYGSTSSTFPQLEAFLDLPASMLRVDAISSTYEEPNNVTVGGPYADACGWQPDPLVKNYASCTGPVPKDFQEDGKVGGAIVVTYTVTVIAPGEGTLSGVVYDNSGSSFHYNADHDKAAVRINATDRAPSADVSITKSADRSTYAGGDLVTYTLTAHNGGPSTAQNVTIDDDLPANLSFVSVTPGASTCTQAAGHVHCDLGALASGADAAVTVRTRAPSLPPVADATGHKLTVSKQEQALALAPGETRTVDVTCAAGGSVSDGSVEVMHVDQGAGSPQDVRVRTARAITAGTYRFTVQNTTTGTAQVKLFATCLPARTDDGQHAVVTDGPYERALGTLAPGRYTYSVDTDNDHLAIAPGIDVASGNARLVGAESSAHGWTFTVEVLQAADVRLSLRGLLLQTGSGGSPAHTHPLVLQHVTTAVALPVGESVQRVSCPVGFKGITATYALPAGVISLGNEPQPINRDFRVLNTTGAPVTVTLDLQCLAIDTGTPGVSLSIVNTATVHSTTQDGNEGDNSDSAVITVLPAAVAPALSEDVAPGGTDAAPAPAAPLVAPSVARIGTVRAAASGSSATVAVRCSGARRCSGTVSLRARKTASSTRGATTKRTTIVLGTARYAVAPGGSSTVKVVIARKYRALVKSGKIRTVTVTAGSTSAVTKLTVR